ncbi:MAG: carbohydrate ABC transporter permease [Eubacteriales bacterium]|nr:carbohydrate ABC transporter permease [Eubacteriales bacterium]
MKNKKRMETAVRTVVMWLLSLIILVPIAMVVLNAVKSQAEAATMSLTLPKEFHFENFRRVIKEGKMINAMKNSLFLAVTSVFITNLGASMGAFVLSRRRTKLTKGIYIFFLVGLLAPINYIPTIRVLQALHLMNKMIGVSLLFSALMLPFDVFLYYGFVSTVPRELDEAAIIDGCGSFQMFFRIQIPLMKPVITTGILINFMNAWNDFNIPLYMLNRSENYPVTMAVYNFYGTYVSSWNLVSAAILISIIPVLIVYLFGQKYIVSGMSAGAVKG